MVASLSEVHILHASTYNSNLWPCRSYGSIINTSAYAKTQCTSGELFGPPSIFFNVSWPLVVVSEVIMWCQYIRIFRQLLFSIQCLRFLTAQLSRKLIIRICSKIWGVPLRYKQVSDWILYRQIPNIKDLRSVLTKKNKTKKKTDWEISTLKQWLIFSHSFGYLSAYPMLLSHKTVTFISLSYLLLVCISVATTQLSEPCIHRKYYPPVPLDARAPRLVILSLFGQQLTDVMSCGHSWPRSLANISRDCYCRSFYAR